MGVSSVMIVEALSLLAVLITVGAALPALPLPPLLPLPPFALPLPPAPPLPAAPLLASPSLVSPDLAFLLTVSVSAISSSSSAALPVPAYAFPAPALPLPLPFPFPAPALLPALPLPALPLPLPETTLVKSWYAPSSYFSAKWTICVLAAVSSLTSMSASSIRTSTGAAITSLCPSSSTSLMSRTRRKDSLPSSRCSASSTCAAYSSKVVSFPSPTAGPAPPGKISSTSSCTPTGSFAFSSKFT